MLQAAQRPQLEHATPHAAARADAEWTRRYSRSGGVALLTLSASAARMHAHPAPQESGGTGLLVRSQVTQVLPCIPRASAYVLQCASAARREYHDA